VSQESVPSSLGNRASGSNVTDFSGLSSTSIAYLISKWVRGEELRHYLPDCESSKKESIGQSAKGERRNQSTIVLVKDSKTAEDLYLDLEFFLKRPNQSPISLLPSWEILPFEPLSPTVENLSNRMEIFSKITAGEAACVIVSVEALAQRCPPRRLVEAAKVKLMRNQELDRDELIQALDILGYRRASLTEETGQFSVRGSVVDIFPAGKRNPVRMEFFGDTLESLREFAADSQRSTEPLESITIVPCQECLAPWRIAEAPLLQRYELASDETLAAAIARLRLLAEESNLPTREADLFEDVLITGGDLPGFEQLTPVLQPHLTGLFELISPETSVVIVDPRGVQQALDNFYELLEEREEQARKDGLLMPAKNALFLEKDQLELAILERGSLKFHSLSEVYFEEPSETEQIQKKKTEIAPLSELLLALRRERQSEFPFRPLAQEIELRRSQGFEVAVAVSHPKKIERFRELLDSYGIVAHNEGESFSDWFDNLPERRKSYRTLTKAPVALLQGALTSGIRVLRDTVLVISDHEIFPDISLRRPSRSAQQSRRVLGTVSQLKEDDFVVHVDHGVALYRGLKEISVDGKPSDFLQLEYADGAKLFVPVENIGKVQKYVGAEGKKPVLNKLGGKNWSQAKEKVRKNIQELAGQLLNLYAQRELAEGISFGPVDSDDQRFSDTFPFQETPDQERAINETLRDMGRLRPMDRLVCGDVGYGKTEVALRAAFKAVNAGKQVAVLVPTTILADQHFKTFRDRLSDFGFNVACVSRFASAADNRKTLEELAEGKIDVIVGTHRLLQKDVFFKEIGLLVIDEEHRFGVADKEKLKKLRADVDVLTLTATPIPRTLHMSLLDIRDLSVIETPPTNRQLTQTYIANYQDSTVREAILRELGRSGQVFYINNRVHNIQAVAEELRLIVPEARVEFAHGQMKEHQLENVMHSFIAHEFDVLVSTTIVESGLDIPNANTIIIRDSDKLGLAELYQLRGRVGRSSRRAYAYLLVKNARTLTGDAKKRLEVLKSLDDLGVGFRLALQDMEIRGAGNLLGKDQSGKIELVGFDLYSRILKEAVRELKTKGGISEAELLIDPEVSTGFPAHIPQSFIPDVEERLLLYQRLNDLRTEEEVTDIREEIRDRFGSPPAEVRMLLEIMELKSILRRGLIINASRRGLSFSLTFHREAKIDQEKLSSLIARSRGKVRQSTPLTVILTLDGAPDSPSVLSEKAKALIRLIMLKAH